MQDCAAQACRRDVRAPVTGACPTFVWRQEIMLPAARERVLLHELRSALRVICHGLK
jgi:hypothetical protein